MIKRRIISQDNSIYGKEQNLKQDKPLPSLESGKCVSRPLSFLLFCPCFFPFTAETSGIPMPSSSTHLSPCSQRSCSVSPSKESVGYLLTAAFASLASSLMEKGNTLFLMWGESERIHQRNLPSTLETVSCWKTPLVPMVPCFIHWTFPFQTISGLSLYPLTNNKDPPLSSPTH